MTNYTSGLEALNLLNDEDTGTKNEFTPLRSGDVKKVKVLGFGDFIGVTSYSIFKSVNTFVPENPPKLSKNGFPVEDLNCWDLAWKYHKDLSQDFGDHHSTEANKYRLKPRFAIGFYDLDAQKEIVIDFSRAQAKKIIQAITKQNDAGRLDKRAFELEKVGSGTSTEVNLNAEIIEDLTEEQQEAFEKAPKEFNKELFQGLYYEMNDEQMLEALTQSGFDVSLIGLTPKQSSEEKESNPFDTQVEDPTQNF